MISVSEAYNRVSDIWDEVRRKKPVDKCIVEFAEKIKSGARVLDVGCGTGYPISAYLSERGFSVHGIDISENMIKKAKALNLVGASFEVCNFFDYFSDEKYGAIVAFDSLFHVEYRRQREVFKKAAELLESGGMFLFTYGKEDGECIGSKMFGEEFYYSSLSATETRERLIDDGFEIVSFILNYAEKNTGTRDLLAVARKL